MLLYRATWGDLVSLGSCGELWHKWKVEILSITRVMW